jgi:hypothetical protein
VYSGIFVHREGVYREGDLCLRGWEGGGLHGVVERVLVQVGFGLGVGGYHDSVDGRDQRRGFCAPLGRASLVNAGLADVSRNVAKFILSVDSRRH